MMVRISLSIARRVRLVVATAGAAQDPLRPHRGGIPVRVTYKPALWLGLLTLSLGLTLTACSSTSTTTSILETPALAVTISGLPTGATGNVVVTGPDDYTTTITGSTTLTKLPAGMYTLTPETVDNGSYLWDAPASQVKVEFGSAAKGAATYKASTGTLKVVIEGFIPTIEPTEGVTTLTITVRGNGINETLPYSFNTSPNQLGPLSRNGILYVRDLPKGSYYVTAPTYPVTPCFSLSGSSSISGGIDLGVGLNVGGSIGAGVSFRIAAVPSIASPVTVGPLYVPNPSKLSDQIPTPVQLGKDTTYHLYYYELFWTC